MSEIITTNDPKQATFDKVALHLLNQGMKSVNDAGDCMYRGDGGRSCAVGCLISDNVYDADVEGGTAKSIEVVNMLYQTNPLIIGIANILDLVEDLQRVHDNVNESNWVYYLKTVAVRYSLSDGVIAKHVNVKEGLQRLAEAMKQQAEDEFKTDAQV